MSSCTLHPPGAANYHAVHCISIWCFGHQLLNHQILIQLLTERLLFYSTIKQLNQDMWSAWQHWMHCQTFLFNDWIPFRNVLLWVFFLVVTLMANMNLFEIWRVFWCLNYVMSHESTLVSLASQTPSLLTHSSWFNLEEVSSSVWREGCDSCTNVI